jgi:hypothetical protein
MREQLALYEWYFKQHKYSARCDTKGAGIGVDR